MSLLDSFKNSNKNKNPLKRTFGILLDVAAYTYFSLSVTNVILDIDNDPEIITLDEYMQINNLPTTLIEGLETDNIFVIEPDNFKAALHLYNKESNPLLYGYNMYNAFETSKLATTTNLQASGTCYIVPAPQDRIERFIKVPYFSDERDFELNVHDYKENAAIFILLHEINHSYYKRYKDEQGTFCDRTVPSTNKLDKLSREIMVEYDAIRTMQNHGYDIEKLAVSIRARDALLHKTENYDLAFYLEPLLKNIPEDDLPDLDGHKEEKEELYKLVKHHRENYSDNYSRIAKTYMAVQDILNSDYDMTARMTRMAEQYKEAYEYLAPNRATELRQERALIFPATAKNDTAQEPMI